MIRTDALMEASLLQHEMQADVRFGSIAGIGGQIAMSALPPIDGVIGRQLVDS